MNKKLGSWIYWWVGGRAEKGRLQVCTNLLQKSARIWIKLHLCYTVDGSSWSNFLLNLCWLFVSPQAKDKSSVPFPFWPGNVDVVAIPVVPEASTMGKTGP